MTVKELQTDTEIISAFNVIKELRPHFQNPESFLSQAKLQQKEGYKLLAIYEDTEVVALMGYRRITTLAWGEVIYIDDLITSEKARRKSYAKTLLDHAHSIVKNSSIKQIHLDSGHSRHVAHKLYLNYGFKIICHHFSHQVRLD